MNSTPICKRCGNPHQIDDDYCPHCGERLKEESLSPSKKIGMYLVSFFLAPFGLGWGFKYLRSKKYRSVGLFIVLLTVISLAISISIIKISMDKYTSLLNSVSPYYLK